MHHAQPAPRPAPPPGPGSSEVWRRTASKSRSVARDRRSPAARAAGRASRATAVVATSRSRPSSSRSRAGVVGRRAGRPVVRQKAPLPRPGRATRRAAPFPRRRRPSRGAPSAASRPCCPRARAGTTSARSGAARSSGRLHSSSTTSQELRGVGRRSQRPHLHVPGEIDGRRVDPHRRPQKARRHVEHLAEPGHTRQPPAHRLAHRLGPEPAVRVDQRTAVEGGGCGRPRPRCPHRPAGLRRLHRQEVRPTQAIQPGHAARLVREHRWRQCRTHRVAIPNGPPPDRLASRTPLGGRCGAAPPRWPRPRRRAIPTVP